MKIIEEPHVEYQVESGISAANYVSPYKISLTFSDGSKNLVDFEPFLKNSKHPSIRKYLKPERFKAFKIVNGNLNWNDYDLIFPLNDLKQGLIK